MIELYSFEVSKVYIENSTIEVTYFAQGFDPVVVSMPAPVKGTKLKDHVAGYAPQAVWDEVMRSLQPVELPLVGSRGVVEIETPLQDMQGLDPLPAIQLNRVDL